MTAYRAEFRWHDPDAGPGRNPCTRHESIAARSQTAAEKQARAFARASGLRFVQCYPTPAETPARSEI